MALSEQLDKLKDQTRQLEQSASEIHTQDKAKVDARLTELRSSLDDAQRDVDAKAKADVADLTDGWANLQKSVTDGFASLKSDQEARQAERQAKRADRAADREVKRVDRAADRAEADAADAIEWAVYALQEAEYYVLAAVVARADADAADAGEPSS
ncbi:hypothetical protein [Agromyces salentinus]|uniref:Uncharacterized protein n=1 Tax=Agromyces salentinus TaxID=269421 RepID=A0ABN2MM20_9MICO|nr:hypothetical protein [Agromyces salentinus]